MVGLTLWHGAAHGNRVELDGGGTLVVADHLDGDVAVTARPQAVAIDTDRPHGGPRNAWPATIDTIEAIGDRVRVDRGRRVWAIKATELTAYPE